MFTAHYHDMGKFCLLTLQENPEKLWHIPGKEELDNDPLYNEATQNLHAETGWWWMSEIVGFGFPPSGEIPSSESQHVPFVLPGGFPVVFQGSFLHCRKVLVWKNRILIQKLLLTYSSPSLEVCTQEQRLMCMHLFHDTALHQDTNHVSLKLFAFLTSVILL